jgi:hypothetical protein
MMIDALNLEDDRGSNCGSELHLALSIRGWASDFRPTR